MGWTCLFLVGCFPEFAVDKANTFVDNLGHDYDQDGEFDETDCDDGNPDITLPIPYFADQDNDGFGTQGDSVLACPGAQPVGYIEAQIRAGEQAFDCDDSIASVHPDAQEVCDGLDNNCSGEIDDYEGNLAER